MFGNLIKAVEVIIKRIDAGNEDFADLLDKVVLHCISLSTEWTKQLEELATTKIELHSYDKAQKNTDIFGSASV